MGRYKRTVSRRARPGALVAPVLMLIFLAGCASPLFGPSSPDQALQIGREVFAENCAVCHGAGGEGQPDWHIRGDNGLLPPPPLNGDGHTWHHGDGLLYRIVSEGGKSLEDPRYPSFRSGMPAFGDRLSHEEIVSVLEYVKSLWGDKKKLGISIQESQALVSEQDPFPSAKGSN